MIQQILCALGGHAYKVEKLVGNLYSYKKDTYTGKDIIAGTLEAIAIIKTCKYCGKESCVVHDSKGNISKIFHPYFIRSQIGKGWTPLEDK